VAASGEVCGSKGRCASCTPVIISAVAAMRAYLCVQSDECCPDGKGPMQLIAHHRGPPAIARTLVQSRHPLGISGMRRHVAVRSDYAILMCLPGLTRVFDHAAF
jgi:hypothetical protein